MKPSGSPLASTLSVCLGEMNSTLWRPALPTAPRMPATCTRSSCPARRWTLGRRRCWCARCVPSAVEFGAGVCCATLGCGAGRGGGCLGPWAFSCARSRFELRVGGSEGRRDVEVRSGNFATRCWLRAEILMRLCWCWTGWCVGRRESS